MTSLSDFITHVIFVLEEQLSVFVKLFNVFPKHADRDGWTGYEFSGFLDTHSTEFHCVQLDRCLVLATEVRGRGVIEGIFGRRRQ